MKNLMQTLLAFVITLASFSNTQAQDNARTQTININNSMPNRLSMTVTVGKQNMMVAIIDGGCIISVPPHKAYKVNSATNSMVEISQAEFGEKVNAGLQQAGGAMPGGSIVSAAVSSVSSMASSGGAGSAAYAASGRKGNWDLKTTETRLQLPNDLPDGDYELTFVIAQSKTGLKDTLKTQVRLAFTLSQGVLKTKHDTAKNSISNIR